MSFATRVAAFAGVAMAGTGMVGALPWAQGGPDHSGHDDDRCGGQGPGASAESGLLGFTTHCCGQGGWSHTTAGRGRGPWPLSVPGPSDTTAGPWAALCVLEVSAPCELPLLLPVRVLCEAAGSAPQLGAGLSGTASTGSDPPYFRTYSYVEFSSILVCCNQQPLLTCGCFTGCRLKETRVCSCRPTLASLLPPGLSSLIEVAHTPLPRSQVCCAIQALASILTELCSRRDSPF